MSKATLYRKDGKVRLARYVRYANRAFCAASAYPVNVSYLQTCLDDIDDAPVALDVTISGASGNCTGPIKYGREGAFLCAPYTGGTLINPDCPPTGYTVTELESDPGGLCATSSGYSFVTPFFVNEFWTNVFPLPGQCYDASRSWFEVAAECPAGTPSGTYGGIEWRRDVHDCATVTKTATAGFFAFSAGSKTVAVGDFIISLVCGADAVSVSAATALFDVGGSWQVRFSGIGNDVDLDDDCTPSGSSVIPIYFSVDAGGAYCDENACFVNEFKCSYVSPVATPVYIGDLTITFERCA